MQSPTNISSMEVVETFPSIKAVEKTIPKLTLKKLSIIKWKDENGEDQKPLRIIRVLSSRWRETGVVLDIEPHDLDAISKKHQKDPYDCCYDVFNMWLEGQCTPDEYPVTWEGLIALLVDLDHAILAKAAFNVVCSWANSGELLKPKVLYKVNHGSVNSIHPLIRTITILQAQPEKMSGEHAGEQGPAIHHSLFTVSDPPDSTGTVIVY